VDSMPDLILNVDSLNRSRLVRPRPHGTAPKSIEGTGDPQT
jgi:hypothetical protein